MNPTYLFLVWRTHGKYTCMDRHDITSRYNLRMMSPRGGAHYHEHRVWTEAENPGLLRWTLECLILAMKTLFKKGAASSFCALKKTSNYNHSHHWLDTLEIMNRHRRFPSNIL